MFLWYGSEMVEENFLNENIEYSDEKQEEDPLLVAQRYLNIFHQIHIFNQSKQDEFDQSLMEVPTKIRESIATIPGGRVLLEYIQDLEKKHGRTSEKLVNIPTKGNQTSTQSPSGGAVVATGITGNLSLGPDFAENLATSLATALKNNNITGNTGNSNITELSQILSKSFNSYASNMQQFTQALITQTRQSANLVQQMQNQTVAQQTQSTTPNSQNQQNLQTNNSNSTTINNVNMDTSFIDKLANVLVTNDTKRHEDFMQLLQVLKQQRNSNPITVMNPTTNTPIISDTSYVEDAIRENNAMQIQAIKSFGEMIVEAITQSQKELAQTIAQSSPRHTVKVVVSQDVDVEDQTNGQTNVITDKKDKKENKTLPNNNNKQEDNSKDKGSFIKNISNKISETTNKFSMPKNNTNKPTENFLDKINKGLNSFKEEMKKQPVIAEKEDKKGLSVKEQQKENKPAINEKKQNNNQIKQSENPIKKEKGNPTEVFNEKIKDNTIESVKEKSIDDILSPTLKDNVKPTDVPIFNTNKKDKDIEIIDTSIDDILLDELLDSKDDNQVIKNIPIKDNQEKREIIKESPIISTPKPISTEQPKPIPTEQTKAQITTTTTTTQPRSEMNTAYKASTSSYVDALEKIKNALSSDVSQTMNADVTPISLNEIDDITTNTFSTENNSKSADIATDNDDDEWEYVEDNGDDEWEYVDENGNPVTNDDEWEYVDESGNPITNDDEWEYVEDIDNNETK